MHYKYIGSMLFAYHRWGLIEAGCDEAGRGCLAGPVVAAAVILPPDYHNASFKAMHLAIDQLKKRPQLILVDGNRFEPYPEIESICIIKGDSQYSSIAAASILAKTYRDEMMKKYAEEFPHYHWHTNVGYPTYEHREAIRRHGLTRLHRRSFRQLPDQLDLF
jgi:ribonuclease HII